MHSINRIIAWVSSKDAQIYFLTFRSLYSSLMYLAAEHIYSRFAQHGAVFFLAYTLVPLLQDQRYITTRQHRHMERSECNSKTGDISSLGEPDPIALLEFYSLHDVCGIPGATVHSYRVLQKATCSRDTTTMFNYHDSNNCIADPTDEDSNPGGQIV